MFIMSIVKTELFVAVYQLSWSHMQIPCCDLHTGVSAPHKPYICERLSVVASWCCTGGLGGCQWQETAPGLEGLVCLCPLWARRWDRLSGPAPLASVV